MKLEKDHIPLRQADHWVWDLVHRLLRACGLVVPLQLGAGHGRSWRVWGRKTEGHGPVWGHRLHPSSLPCIVPTLSHVPVRSSASPEALASGGRLSRLALVTRPLPGDVAMAPTAALSGQPGLRPDCWVCALPRKEPSVSSPETMKPKMPWGPHRIRWTLALPWKSWSGPSVLVTSCGHTAKASETGDRHADGPSVARPAALCPRLLPHGHLSRWPPAPWTPPHLQKTPRARSAPCTGSSLAPPLSLPANVLLVEPLRNIACASKSAVQSPPFQWQVNSPPEPAGRQTSRGGPALWPEVPARMRGSPFLRLW